MWMREQRGRVLFCWLTGKLWYLQLCWRYHSLPVSHRVVQCGPVVIQIYLHQNTHKRQPIAHPWGELWVVLYEYKIRSIPTVIIVAFNAIPRDVWLLLTIILHVYVLAILNRNKNKKSMTETDNYCAKFKKSWFMKPSRFNVCTNEVLCTPIDKQVFPLSKQIYILIKRFMEKPPLYFEQPTV